MLAAPCPHCHDAKVHAPLPPIIPPELLLSAYRQGIFPMAAARDDDEIFWVEPRERAIIPLNGFHLSRSLARTLRKGTFRVTCNAAFREVVRECAGPREDAEGTWISQRVELSYAGLHDTGHAHSVECWQGYELVGGLYGVSLDRVFCGESMFSRARDASKVALVWLVALMRRAGYELLDCQFITDHLKSLGAVEIPQARYVELLGEASANPPIMSLPRAYSALMRECGDHSSPGKLISQSFTQTS